MEYLQRIQSIAWRIDQKTFEQAHPGYYILGALPAVAAMTQPRRSFSTKQAISTDVLRSALESDARVVGRFLYKIAKSERNPFRDRISLGRASNNDLVVSHPSVSKIHAHFLADELDGPTGPASFDLQDGGSRNGTSVNGRAVIEGPPVTLEAGDSLKFGDIQCEYLDAGGLHFIMRTRFPLSRGA